MRYMMFIQHNEDYRGKRPPAGLLEAMGTFVGDSVKNGTFIDGGGLKPPVYGHKVRLSKGKLSVTDGPFAETKEIVGGYALIEAKSEQHALDIAKQFMDLHRQYWPEFEGACEVRPIEDRPPDQWT